MTDASQLVNYSPTVAKTMIAAVRRGASITLASSSGGISRQTLKKWLAIGEEDLENGRETEMAAFTKAFRDAEWEFAGGMLDLISGAAPEDWHAAAWVLERRYPKEFGKTVVEHENSEEAPISLRVDDLKSVLKEIREEEERQRNASNDQAGNASQEV